LHNEKNPYRSPFPFLNGGKNIAKNRLLVNPFVSDSIRGTESQVHFHAFNDGHFPVSFRHLWRFHRGKWAKQAIGRDRRGGIAAASFLKGHEISQEKRMSL